MDEKRFSRTEYERRYRLTADWLEKTGVDVLLLYANSYGNGGIRWLTGFAARHDTYLLWPRIGEPVLLTQLYNHVPNAQRVSAIADVRWGGSRSAETVLALLRQRGFASDAIGLAGRVPYNDYLCLAEGLPGATWLSRGKGFMDLRLVKSQEELDWLSKGAAFTDAAMEALVSSAHIGTSEHELAAAIEAAYTAAGGEHGIHFLSSTPMNDPQSYVPAQTQTSRRLAAGDVVISELSAGLGGYAGQIHRPVAIGRQPNERYTALYEVALEAYQRIVGVLRPGETVASVLEAADSIAKAGYSVCDDLLHGYGQGYLPPVIRTRQTAHNDQPPEDFQFRENMTVVVQPNVYHPENGAGLQLGNLLVIERHGARSLQQYPLQFPVTDA